MVELADTQASEACSLKQGVGVQLSLAAHEVSRTFDTGSDSVRLTMFVNRIRQLLFGPL